jgi:trigger factor
VTIEDLGNCKKKLLIEVPTEKVTEELDKRTRELQASAELPGFRRGHIPPKLFERRFGKKMREALKNDLTAEAFEEALSEHSLEPLGEPEFPGIEEIELERESTFKFEVHLIVKPQVKVEDYMKVKVQAEEIEVIDEEIDDAVERLRRERAELVVVEDRESAGDDMLMVNVEVTAEGQSLYSSKNSYIGAGSKGIFGMELEELPDKLLGRNRGDVIELEFELPKTSALEYAEEMVGKKAKCTLEVNEIKTLDVPDANDKWAKEVGFESLAALREKVAEEVKSAKEHGRDNYVERKILDQLIESCGFEVPTDMIEARARELTEYRRYQLLKAGVETDKIDADLDSYSELSRQEIERNFRDSLILGKIAELENIFVTEDEVDMAIAQIALSRGQSPDSLREEMDSRGMVSRLRSELLESRVKRFLREKAEIELLAPGSLYKEEESKGQEKDAGKDESGEVKADDTEESPGENTIGESTE